jgi:Predicted phosphatases
VTLVVVGTLFASLWFGLGRLEAAAVSGPAAILDIDGTLVDSNYQHAIAWYRALRQHGHVLPIWRIHRHIGMGGDQLVGALCGEEVEEREGDDIRGAEKALYMALIDEVEPLAGARELIEDLKRMGRTVVLASSAKPDEVEHYLDLLDARGLAGRMDDLGRRRERPSPSPTSCTRHSSERGPDSAVMIGDSTWDCEAAGRAGVQTIAVLTGGFSDQELRDAGAVAVYHSIEELRQSLSDTPLG